MFGELEPSDTEWTCAGGFVTETQIFYNILEDGTSVMCQLIHSAIGYIRFHDVVYLSTNVFSTESGTPRFSLHPRSTILIPKKQSGSLSV